MALPLLQPAYKLLCWVRGNTAELAKACDNKPRLGCFVLLGCYVLGGYRTVDVPHVGETGSAVASSCLRGRCLGAISRASAVDLCFFEIHGADTADLRPHRDQTS